MSNNAHELSNRLLNALDNNYNVVDMHAVNEIISILERFNITKELLETTRLGKHVNELRRKTNDPSLARRAKVLVKRWRDLVIPTVNSPGHTGSNRSSAERAVRRLGGTPLTSPALTRQVVSPAVNSPRPPSRPAWGGYESDSQDVILVDDDPPPPPPITPAYIPDTQKLENTTTKRPPSPQPLQDEKKAKRDKKPKKRRGHSRAGSGSESVEADSAWTSRNGGHERRKNGTRTLDPYAALVNKIPQAGKKVKTTAELLEQIQSRGAKTSAPPSPRADSPDVMLIEPDTCTIKVDSPVRNGASPPATPPAARSPSPPRSPLEEWPAAAACTCGASPRPHCPAAPPPEPEPSHVSALHRLYIPGVNGTKAPPHAHRFAVRRAQHQEYSDLFASVVPLYKYSDYADDYCVKDISRVQLCSHLPEDEFAPAPPSPSPPPPPPELRPYPLEEPAPPPDEHSEPAEQEEPSFEPVPTDRYPIIKPEMVSLPVFMPSVRLKAPILPEEEGDQELPRAEVKPKVEPCVKQFEQEPVQHRTVERRRDDIDGAVLQKACSAALDAAQWGYSQAAGAALARAGLRDASPEPATEARDELGRPERARHFAEWHECALLGGVLALPYVVID